MTRRFRQMLLIGRRVLRWTWFGGLLSSAHLLVTLLLVALLRGAWLLVALLARLLTLAVTRRLIAIAATRRVAMSSLPVLRARWARGFCRDVCWRHEAVYRNYWNLTFDQPFNVSEKL